MTLQKQSHPNGSRYGFLTNASLDSISVGRTGTKQAINRNKIEEKAAARFLPKSIVAIYPHKSSSAYEMGFCCLCTDSSELILSTFSDSQTYVKTIHKLDVYNPTEVILPENCVNPSLNKLALIVRSNIEESVKITAMKPKMFDSVEGKSLLRFHQLHDDKIINYEDIEPAIAAACACIQHMRKSKSITEMLKKLRIKVEICDSTMFIDSRTIKDLELTENLLDSNGGTSFFKLLNNCCTKMGQRQLKINLLQPLTDVESINLRLESVQELIRQQSATLELRSNLKQYHNLDQLIGDLIRVPKNSNSFRLSDQRINNIILIKQTLEDVEVLKNYFENIDATLLNEINEILHNPELQSLLHLICEYINEDCTWAGNSLDLKNQRCYAVKSGKNGLLDVSRRLYTSITEDVAQTVSELSEEFGLSLDFRYDQNRGFYIRLKNPPHDLPPVFINKVRKKSILEFSTFDLMKQNSRFNDVINEITLLCEKTVEELHSQIEDYIPILFMVSEAIATLDLLCCFAFNAFSNALASFTSPEFSDRLQIRQGRHPILVKKLGERLVPNDYQSLKDISRFKIVTGPNMSGKSSYLKQLCYLVILSQMGAFVPADYCLMPIFKNLHVRIGVDNVEMTASSFSREMTEMAHIINYVNEDTLLIIDELGRGSSYEDGFSIAIAISEFLIQSKATVFMSTHFRDLYEVLRGKACVASLHMKVDLVGDFWDMKYKAELGANEIEEYGIKYVETTQAIPPQLTDLAKVIAVEIKSRSGYGNRDDTLVDTRKRKLIWELCYVLQKLRCTSIDKKGMIMIMKTLQDKFVREITNVSDTSIR